MTLAGKSVIAVATIGSIGGVGAYASGLFDNKFKPKEIKPTIEKSNFRVTLKKEGFEVLNTSKNDAEWEKILKEYQQVTDKSFSKTKEANKTQEQLRSDCEKVLKEENLDSENYPLARRWCVKKEGIDKVLQRGGYKLLKFTDEEDAGEKEIWKKKLEKLNSNKDAFEAVKGNLKEGSQHESDNIKALKKGCTDLQISTTETTSNIFEKNFELAKEWCSIKNNDTNR